MICTRNWAKPLTENANSRLAAAARRWKTPLRTLHNEKNKLAARQVLSEIGYHNTIVHVSLLFWPLATLKLRFKTFTVRAVGPCTCTLSLEHFLRRMKWIKVRNDSVRKYWSMQSCALTLQITKKIETLTMENL